MDDKIGCQCPVLRQVMQKVALGTKQQLDRLHNPIWRKVIVLSGPTGVGKTNLSLALAERLGGEIISADSMQVYRGMDIGTAKISPAEKKRVPHHLIDICDITQPFNVVDFYECAKEAINDILSRKKVPIVVGGTGFYIHALLYGPPNGPPSDSHIRATLEQEAEKFGIELLYERLENIDPVYAHTITKSDEHKIVRALEIIQISGQLVSSFSWKERPVESFYHFLCYFMHMPRKELYPLLEKRCDQMLENGMLEEVVELDRKGIRTNLTARQAIGYKQSLRYLDTAKTAGDYQAFVEEFKAASRHLAKRQYTWFRKEPLFLWLDMTQLSPEAFLELIIHDYHSDNHSSSPTIC